MVGVVVLLPLALTSLGMAAGSPSTVGNSSSHGTSSGASAASAGCSKATAVQVVERLHLSDPGIPNPSHRVGQVLCGTFVGPGSQAMVATIANGTCWPNSGWAVFRLTGGGAWQLVPNGYHSGFVAALGAVGSDIRETVPVWLRRDGPCNPSGGTRARVWHWNGSRLVPSRWTLTKSPSPATTHLFYFMSPSGNITCSSGDEGQASCVSRNRPQSAGLLLNGTVTICRGSRCVHAASGRPTLPVVGYGQVNEQGGFRCRSELTGMTCTVMLPGKGFGKGFVINRDSVSRVGS